MKMKYAISINDYNFGLTIISPTVFDQEEDLLIFDSIEDREAYVSGFPDINNDCERLDLMMLTECPDSPLFTDYGFISNKGIPYLYAYLSALFSFENPDNDHNGNRHAAFIQMEEHVIGITKEEDRTFYIVDRELQPLIEGIAHAYGIKVKWL